MVKLDRLVDSQRHQQEEVLILVNQVVDKYKDAVSYRESSVFKEIPIFIIRAIESNNSKNSIQQLSFAQLSLHVDIDALNDSLQDHPLKGVAKKAIQELLALLSQYSFLFKEANHE